MQLMVNVIVRAPLVADELLINAALVQQGWSRRPGLYARYLQMHEDGTRDVLVAEAGNTFAGYLTIAWQSDYAGFASQNIPEIVDFNVLISQQRRGVGTCLMDEAEARIARRSPLAGIGVGVTASYAAAHALYLKRGYLPDGAGLCHHGKPLTHGSTTVVDDSLNLYFTKRLRK